MKSVRRKQSLLAVENGLHQSGYRLVAGMDEVGRGPLAGPVCAAAVIFPPGTRINGVEDSKKLTPDERAAVLPRIRAKAIGIGIGYACSEEIDRINILNATKLAMKRAIRNLQILPDFIILDAITLPDVSIPQRGLIKGDASCFSIAAASIVAKVARDDLMARHSEEYPGYSFEQNKGYGTQAHWNGLRAQGPATIHRRTFIDQYCDCEKLLESSRCRGIRARLAAACTPGELRDMLREIHALRHFLPKCETACLLQALRERTEQLATHAADDLPSALSIT